MDIKILTINAGSSTYKTSLFQYKKETGESPVTFTLLWKDLIESEGAKGTTLEERIRSLWQGEQRKIQEPSEIAIVGHRVVNGGDELFKPIVVTNQVKQAIHKLIPLAPLHNPVNLKGIEMLEALLPKAKQVAVFDTGFHHSLPETVATYPIPYEWRKKGIKRYGFHGISHQYCSQRVGALLKNDHLKIVSCHLGNGSSLAAINGGVCLNTTMGFTPLEGLMMGTRSGSIDPAILLYLMRNEKFSTDSLDRLLNDQSGCKGICGTHDMREIEKRAANKDQLAILALNMYTERVKMAIAAMIASLSGIDVLLFTAGIGENSPKVRSKVCQGLEFAGIHLDANKNSKPSQDSDISIEGSSVRIFVINTQEDLAIAQACANLIYP